jgi:hypothetical protein
MINNRIRQVNNNVFSIYKNKYKENKSNNNKENNNYLIQGNLDLQKIIILNTKIKINNN